MHLFYTTFTWDEYLLYVAATERGLCFISAGPEGEAELKKFHQEYFQGQQLQKDKHKMEKYQQDIEGFLLGKKQAFQSKLEFYGTNFQQDVWKALLAIPYGETRSYTQIAQEINRPEAVRAIANAIGKNPLLFVVPCHRVIRKDGNLSGFRAGIAMKKKLLQLEKLKVS